MSQPDPPPAATRAAERMALLLGSKGKGFEVDVRFFAGIINEETACAEMAAALEKGEQMADREESDPKAWQRFWRKTDAALSRYHGQEASHED